MPAEQGVGLDEMEGIAPPPEESRKQDHQESVAVAQRGTRGRSARHDQLLAQHCILCDELGFGAGGVLDDARQCGGGLEESPDRSADRPQAAGNGGLGDNDRRPPTQRGPGSSVPP